MGCDWIEGEQACFGYAVEYEKVFHDTRFDVEQLYSEECMEEYEDTNIPYSAIRNAWHAFWTDKYAHILGYKIEPIIGCKTLPVAYEATRMSEHCEVVFGYRIESKAFTEEADDEVHALPVLKFPKSMRIIIEEFVSSFRAVEVANYAESTTKKRKRYSPVKPLEVESAPRMVIFVN